MLRLELRAARSSAQIVLVFLVLKSAMLCGQLGCSPCSISQLYLTASVQPETSWSRLPLTRSLASPKLTLQVISICCFATSVAQSLNLRFQRLWPSPAAAPTEVTQIPPGPAWVPG